MDALIRGTEIIPEEAKRHLLHIEDDPMYSDLIKKVLDANGYIVTHASEGVSGMLAFNENPEQWIAVLIDLNIPHMHGTTLLQEMHRIRPELPLIVLTGAVGENLDAYESGATIVIKKPILPAKLLEDIRAAIGSKLSENIQ